MRALAWTALTVGFIISVLSIVFSIGARDATSAFVWLAPLGVGVLLIICAVMLGEEARRRRTVGPWRRRTDR